MHTKKTNNINKLMQISYHSALTTIQKLQNLKKKKKKGIGHYCPKLACMADIWSVQLVFKLVRNIGISIPINVPVWYIQVGTAGTSTISTTLVLTLQNLLKA